MEYAMSQKTSLRAEFQFGKESISADGLKLQVKPERTRDFRLGVAYKKHAAQNCAAVLRRRYVRNQRASLSGLS